MGSSWMALFGGGAGAGGGGGGGVSTGGVAATSGGGGLFTGEAIAVGRALGRVALGFGLAAPRERDSSTGARRSSAVAVVTGSGVGAATGATAGTTAAGATELAGFTGAS